MIIFGTLPKGNYPFLALPRPGSKPFVVRRDKFMRIMDSLEGREIKWEIVMEPERILTTEDNPRDTAKPFTDPGYKHVVVDGREREKLIIRHRNGHGRGVVKFYNQLDAGSYPLRQQCEKWLTDTMRQHGRCPCYEFARNETCKHIQTRERREVMKTLGPRQRQIMKLEEERDKIKLPRPSAPWQLDKPRCGNCEEWERWHEDSVRYGRECAGYTPGSYYTQGEREQWLRWIGEKDLRREIMRRVRAWQTSVDKSIAKLYKIVEQAGIGVKVERWSKMHTGEKRHFDEDFSVYLKRLWEACGLTRRPRIVDYSHDNWSRDRYKLWMDNLHQRKELQGMIDALIAEDISK